MLVRNFLSCAWDGAVLSSIRANISLALKILTMFPTSCKSSSSQKRPTLQKWVKFLTSFLGYISLPIRTRERDWQVVSLRLVLFSLSTRRRCFVSSLWKSNFGDWKTWALITRETLQAFFPLVWKQGTGNNYLKKKRYWQVASRPVLPLFFFPVWSTPCCLKWPHVLFNSGWNEPSSAEKNHFSPTLLFPKTSSYFRGFSSQLWKERSLLMSAWIHLLLLKRIPVLWNAKFTIRIR